MKREESNNYLMKINAATGEESVFVNYTEINENLPEGLDAARASDVTSDYTGFLFTKENDLFYYSVLANEVKKLTETEATENNPTFSPGGKKVAFTREHNLFVVNVETGVETQLTFDGSEIIYNGWASWVYWEEILGRATKHKAFWWAPNSKMISFLRFDDSPVPKFPLFIADGVHGELEWAHYPKAGDPNPNVKLGVVYLNEDKLVWVDEDKTVDQYTAWPFWTKNSNELFYQVLNRGQDTLQILSADPNSGKNRNVYTEVQPTWVNFFEDIYIFENGSGFILRSDKDGWRHLYYYDVQGNLVNKITEGDWAVKEIINVDEENGVIYFEGSVNSTVEKHLYKVNLDGTELVQLTETEGTHKTNVSPHGSYFYSNYSNINQPAKLELFNRAGESIRVISDRKTELFDEYDLGTGELLTITTEDGFELPAMWVLPPGFDKEKKYPVIFSVYGGPEYQDVRNSFSSYLKNKVFRKCTVTLVSGKYTITLKLLNGLENSHL
jgi:dipeptidyl-peptidase-4